MLFRDVVGQEDLKRHLIEEVKDDKISHAQLFLGKSGYGGLPLALAFVQYLFCEDKQDQDSCGVCGSCKKVQDLQHPDLHFSFPVVLSESKTTNPLLPEWREMIKENPYFNLNQWLSKIDPKGRKPTIGTDETQEILKKLVLKSYEGGYKVMVIWQAEEMNTVGANKLLKIIEEPPARTLFLLISDSQDAMLKTILSRTQVVNLPRIQTDAISMFLRDKHQLNASNSDSVAGRSDGDLLTALDLIGDQKGQDVNREHFINLMRISYKKDVLQMMAWADEIAAESKENQKNFLKYALHMFRQSMLKNYTDDILLRVSEQEADFLDKFSKFISGNNILDFMNTFSEAHYHLERNANSKILFTNICFNVMRYIHVA